LEFPYLSNFLTYSGVLFYSLFIVVPYALFIYIWASIKTVEILKAAKQDNYNQGKNTGTAIGALIFFVITQLLGISIAILFSLLGTSSRGEGNPIPVIFALGLAMIPSQVISFMFIRRLGKAEKAAE
jgi:TRAP-type mannitol/chloroaromatic compound transport system permease large subunit